MQPIIPFLQNFHGHSTTSVKIDSMVTAQLRLIPKPVIMVNVMEKRGGFMRQKRVGCKTGMIKFVVFSNAHYTDATD